MYNTVKNFRLEEVTLLLSTGWNAEMALYCAVVQYWEGREGRGRGGVGVEGGGGGDCVRIAEACEMIFSIVISLA